jgi:HlyD family secretion protein
VQALAATSAVSKNDLDAAADARDRAAVALQSSRDKLAQYEAGTRRQDIDSQAARLMQARAALAQAELDLADTMLKCPSDGVVLTRAVEPGTMLQAGGTVFTISLTRPVWVRAYVGGANLARAIPGARLEIFTDARPGRPYSGSIGFVSPTAEFTPKTVQTPELRTDLVYRLRVIVNDPDEALRQGMPVTLCFPEGS